MSPALANYRSQQVISDSQAAAARTDEILQAIAARIQPGMRESEAVSLATTVFAEFEAVQQWHRPYIRFGEHSILTFKQRPRTDLVLKDEDIVFIDIGPIIRHKGLRIEGDAGMTMAFGNNALFNDLAAFSGELFTEARDYWREHQPTGIALHEWLHRRVAERGYIFHLDPAGHLIGAFPHKGWKHGLSAYPEPIEPGLWILEIQFRHPTLPYGAFHEAILV